MKAASTVNPTSSYTEIVLTLVLTLVLNLERSVTTRQLRDEVWKDSGSNHAAAFRHVSMSASVPCADSRQLLIFIMPIDLRIEVVLFEAGQK